jgi:hypothetical protein
MSPPAAAGAVWANAEEINTGNLQVRQLNETARNSVPPLAGNPALYAARLPASAP